MHGFGLSPVLKPGRNKGAGESLLGHRQTKRQTGGVGICVRFERSGEKVRGAWERNQSDADRRQTVAEDLRWMKWTAGPQ